MFSRVEKDDRCMLCVHTAPAVLPVCHRRGDLFQHIAHDERSSDTAVCESQQRAVIAVVLIIGWSRQRAGWLVGTCKLPGAMGLLVSGAGDSWLTDDVWQTDRRTRPRVSRYWVSGARHLPRTVAGGCLRTHDQLWPRTHTQRCTDRQIRAAWRLLRYYIVKSVVFWNSYCLYILVFL